MKRLCLNKSFIVTLVLSAIILNLNNLQAQTKTTYSWFWYNSSTNRAGDATISEANRQYSSDMLKLAYEAYNSGDMEKTRYYLNQSVDNGWTDASFFYLFGKWCYDKGNKSCAKRYWKKGFRTRGCWECRELVRKMKKGGKIE